MDLPLTLTIDRCTNGFVAKLPDRTLTAESLWELFEALFREFEDADDLRAANAALEEMKQGGAIPWEEVKARLGL